MARSFCLLALLIENLVGHADPRLRAIGYLVIAQISRPELANRAELGKAVTHAALMVSRHLWKTCEALGCSGPGHRGHGRLPAAAR
jgi:hypothetical protein